MYDLNQTLFYKTKFELVGDETIEDVLWEIVVKVKRWICRKHHGILDGAMPTWTKFKYGSVLVSDDGTVRLDSAHYENEGSTFWACRISEESFVKERAPRKWVTELGVSVKGHFATLSLVLSYNDRPGYIGLCQDDPQPTIPRIVREILEDERFQCVISGIPLKPCLVELNVGDFPSFWRTVKQEDRDIPIVYISPKFNTEGKPKLLIKPKKMAQMLGPSAIVYYSKSKDFVVEMQNMVDNLSMRCENGSIRVYACRPRSDDPGDWTRHRFFSPTQIEEVGADVVLAILRRALAQDVHFYETMMRVENVREMIDTAARRKRDEENVQRLNEELSAGKDRANAEALEFMIRCDEQRMAAEDERDSLKQALVEERANSFELGQKAAYLEEALKAQPYHESLDISKMPETRVEVAEFFQANYPDRIAFTKRAIQSLDDCDTSPAVLWLALYDLATIAYELLSGNAGVDLARQFNSRSKFTYARGAGSKTRKDKGLMRAYKDTYEGREIDVQRHIKKGSKPSDPDFVRMYFDYDDLSGRIVISYCSHLDNFTTRKLS